MLMFISDNDFHGLVLAALFIGLFIIGHKTNHRLAYFFDVVVLSICAGITWGFSSNSMVTQFEYLFDFATSAIVALCALASLYKNSSKKYLVYGYLVHGVWDALHHNLFHIGSTKMPYWYPTFCFVYDLFVAGFYFNIKMK